MGEWKMAALYIGLSRVLCLPADPRVGRMSELDDSPFSRSTMHLKPYTV